MIRKKGLLNGVLTGSTLLELHRVRMGAYKVLLEELYIYIYMYHTSFQGKGHWEYGDPRQTKNRSMVDDRNLHHPE